MSIADADAKAAMPAGDTAPDVGTMLKANMSQPIRKGVAKWTDTVRKMEVRSPNAPRRSAARRARTGSADARAIFVTQVGEEVEVLETQVNPENSQIRCVTEPQERCAARGAAPASNAKAAYYGDRMLRRPAVCGGAKGAGRGQDSATTDLIMLPLELGLGPHRCWRRLAGLMQSRPTASPRLALVMRPQFR